MVMDEFRKYVLDIADKSEDDLIDHLIYKKKYEAIKFYISNSGASLSAKNLINAFSRASFSVAEYEGLMKEFDIDYSYEDFVCMCRSWGERINSDLGDLVFYLAREKFNISHPENINDRIK